MPRRLACVEVGGSGTQTVLFDGGDPVEIDAGAFCPEGFALAIACPGVINGSRVDATNLQWIDADPAHELGLTARPVLVMNDAAAAALGEAALGSGAVDDLLYVGLGTGIGGARVRRGRVTAENLLGHQVGFGDAPCRCGGNGCLETVAGGWALPDPLSPAVVLDVVAALAAAIERDPEAGADTVVVAGGIVDRHPAVVAALAAELPDRRILGSARPPKAKSAAPWGLRAAVAV